MTRIYYAEREALKTYLSAVIESNHVESGRSSCTELLCQIEPGTDVMKIQTRADIAPIQAVAYVPVQTHCEMGLTVTLSFEGLHSILGLLVPSEFVGLEFTSTSAIRVFSAVQTSILDDAPDFCQIDLNSNYSLNSNEPGLLSEYSVELPSNLPCALKVTSKHSRIFDSVHDIGKKIQQPSQSIVLYSQSEFGIRVELQSEEVFARFILSNVSCDEELKSALGFDAFKALKKVVSKLIKSKSKGVKLFASNEKIVLEHAPVNAQLTCVNVSQTFMPPSLTMSNSGFIEEDPHKLVRMLAQLDVASTSVDDVVKIQISDKSLLASINTETADADLRMELHKVYENKMSTAVEVKRILLTNCLKSFAQGQFVRIHGLLTDDPKIMIQSTVNEDFVVIAKMAHVGQAAA